MSLLKPPAINLARRPFRNNSIYYGVFGTCLVLMAAATGYNVYDFINAGGNIARLEQDYAEKWQKFVELSDEVERMKKEVGGLDLTTLNAKSAFANGLILSRLFSWSTLFDRIEDLIPPHVRIRSIRPSISTKGIEIQIDGMAQTPEDLYEFEQALVSSEYFSGVYPVSENSKESRGEINFDLSMNYVPAGRTAVTTAANRIPATPTEGLPQPETTAQTADPNAAVADPNAAPPAAGGPAAPAAGAVASAAEANRPQAPAPGPPPSGAAGAPAAPNVTPATPVSAPAGSRPAPQHAAKGTTAPSSVPQQPAATAVGSPSPPPEQAPPQQAPAQPAGGPATEPAQQAPAQEPSAPPQPQVTLPPKPPREMTNKEFIDWAGQDRFLRLRGRLRPIADGPESDLSNEQFVQKHGLAEFLKARGDLAAAAQRSTAAPAGDRP